jgi:hypothetical protein
VVIAVRPAARERIPQPKPAIERHLDRNVGEGCGALVGGDHEIGILAIVRDDLIRVDDLPFDDVVGDRQERADEDAVAFGPFGEPRVPVGGGGSCLG